MDTCFVNGCRAKETEERAADSEKPDKKRCKETLNAPEATDDLYLEWKFRIWDQIVRHAATR